MHYKVTDLVKLTMLVVLGRDTGRSDSPLSMTYSYLVGEAKDLLYTLPWIKEDIYRNQAYNLPFNKTTQDYVTKLDSSGYKATEKLIGEYEGIESQFHKYLKILQKHGKEGTFGVTPSPINEETLRSFEKKYSEVEDSIKSTLDYAEQILKDLSEQGAINNDTFSQASKILSLKYYFDI